MSLVDRETQPGFQPHEQPGLEVVPHEQLEHSQDWSGLQAANPSSLDSGKEAISGHNDAGKTHVVPNQIELGGPTFQGAPVPKRRLWFIVGGIAFALVTAAAVVGGILGSKAAKHSQGEFSLPTSTPTPTIVTSPTTRLQSIRQGSPLTITGWSQSGGVEMFLFYQDHDNQIQRSVYDTSGTSAGGNSSWQSPQKFNSFASADTRLGGTIIQYNTSYKPQTELYYTNSDGRVLGVSINDELNPSYEEDSIKSLALSSRVNSSVAAYWPWFIYQEVSGVIVEVRNRLLDEFAPAAEWDTKRLNAIADDDSRLALVPLSTNFDKMAVQGGYGIFYQVDGGLVALIPDLGSDQLAKDYADSWPTTVKNMPKGASLAAFSVARTSDSLQRVNTYVLYLDSDSNISVIYSDSSSWQTVQPAAMKGVDPDTDIACLTMAITHLDSLQQEVLLGEYPFDARCYFQREGLVREVILSNNEWTDSGNVPIP
ncbi:hypothetical protein CORC01_13439 [Colletotrichum orchidophilum]|uniref:Fucose-specific lectin n=1 Tax=Colletotrichum orchidophilum TaxID=1209926 RepID=A0A1G4AQA4_9PEZI|nr:uncharacterized protein CORC01_13439 [Colletotrichum orchidophilum]OHE91281.1 hypothetical protein CORC01_13439 [Colletotrichum orchidophilum]